MDALNSLFSLPPRKVSFFQTQLTPLFQQLRDPEKAGSPNPQFCHGGCLGFYGLESFVAVHQLRVPYCRCVVVCFLLCLMNT
jgi:hypothetical protein